MSGVSIHHTGVLAQAAILCFTAGSAVRLLPLRTLDLHLGKRTNASVHAPEMVVQRSSEQWQLSHEFTCDSVNGTLKVIDRKKLIFKLSQGEYIVPEKIEREYEKSQYVDQVFVHGESLKSCVVAVVVPNVDVLKCWAAENRIVGTLSTLCAHPEVKRIILEDISSRGKEAGLKSFEQVKDIYLHPDHFSVKNGLLTPASKPKRRQLRAYFKPQLEDLYKGLH
ncbi:hypothetical protein QAD02_021341 [Eretmocerus hayati]|uniref:Uncharacterized protein n=1 Tax=Eretmocerus hayati TaxID=131215 RepID=A0ACC2PR06_9HYME|nr:hypothetical protein QAD02_021341 [Eretmocerus hayati]